jgi:hypothetical protein
MTEALKMKSFYLSIVLLIFGSWASAQSHALGVANGGGGKGVVCRNPDQSIRSVELLDLWEGQELRNQVPVVPTQDLATTVDAALLNLSNALHLRSTGDNCMGPTCFVREMRETAAKFVTNSNSLQFLRGVRLEDTGDAMEVVRPENCAVEQIVNYQRAGAPILVNQDLYEKLDLTNQAALIAHESFYALLRTHVGEATSIRTRRAVSYVFSGHGFVFPDPLNIKTYYDCQAQHEIGQNGQILGTELIIGGDFKLMYFVTVAGTPLISLKPLENTPDTLKYLIEGRCNDGADDSLDVYENGSGDEPVEFDREINIVSECKHGKRQLTVNARAPGETQFSTLALTCQKKTK